MQQWYTRIVKPNSGQIGQWVVDVTINQSIAGAAHRFFTTHWHIENRNLVSTPDKYVVSANTLKVMVYSLDLALLAASAWALGAPMRRRGDERRLGVECSLMFILMLLLSPMSHKTHFGILMLPGFFVARMWIQQRDRLAAGAMIVCLISIGLLDRDFFGAALGDMFAWYGSVMWGAVALGVACFYALAKDKPSAFIYPATTD
jgi:hypothetical protein